jgi:hypothetical protein
LSLEHVHTLLVHKSIAQLNVLRGEDLTTLGADYLQQLAYLIDLELVCQLLLRLVLETCQTEFGVYLPGSSPIEQGGHHGHRLLLLNLLEQMVEIAAVARLNDVHDLLHLLVQAKQVIGTPRVSSQQKVTNL